MGMGDNCPTPGCGQLGGHPGDCAVWDHGIPGGPAGQTSGDYGIAVLPAMVVGSEFVPALSAADIDRIADRVVEKLRAQGGAVMADLIICATRDEATATAVAESEDGEHVITHQPECKCDPNGDGCTCEPDVHIVKRGAA